ncbi:hypothetical protein Ahy_A10g049524 [Arachis hypogaea]|uniref:AB hydrolase-1 domain-containing protein n=1 Tax=Arachis hypogaea TaxID=3818 RepID=A0A445B7C9_ARAHY|nr:hypothetical protein Ahy_A10g049524 [Arachis hypogaea]
MEHVKKKHHQTLVFILFLIILSSLTSKSGSSSPESSQNRKHHFVLVHGACHGAWSWYKVITLLKSWGHNVTALDLAASGVNQKQVLELRSISEYFEPLTEFMTSSVGEDERVVLVGHSLGGLAISHAMEHFPHKISVAVFVTAFMPGPTANISAMYQMLRRDATERRYDKVKEQHKVKERVAIEGEAGDEGEGHDGNLKTPKVRVSVSCEGIKATLPSEKKSLTASTSNTKCNVDAFSNSGSLLDNHYTYDEGRNKPATTFAFGPHYLGSRLYQLSSKQDWNLATTLVRPLKLFSNKDITKVLTLSHTKYSSVSRIFVVSEKDLVVSPNLQRWMIEHNPPNRVVEIAGSDHMIMMSKPIDLCLQLQSIAANYD